MGRFIREQLAREGVATDGIVTDPERLTALVLLAVEDEGVSPMIFYRADCADMALTRGRRRRGLHRLGRAPSSSPARISPSRNTEAAQRKAIRIAKANGGKVVFDIDYRPNLWGLAGHAAGFERYVKSDTVSGQAADRAARLRPDRRHRGGDHDRLRRRRRCSRALKAIRALSPATIVLKRGADGLHRL